jgi:Flp pilus assembly CpaF family ATPase
MAGSGSTASTRGLVDAGLTIAPADAERILRLVAHHVAAEIHAERPRLSAELPAR